jgi:GNAT superfamily N-acetyltransferase
MGATDDEFDDFTTRRLELSYDREFDIHRQMHDYAAYDFQWVAKLVEHVEIADGSQASTTMASTVLYWFPLGAETPHFVDLCDSENVDLGLIADVIADRRGLRDEFKVHRRRVRPVLIVEQLTVAAEHRRHGIGPQFIAAAIAQIVGNAPTLVALYPGPIVELDQKTLEPLNEPTAADWDGIRHFWTKVGFVHARDGVAVAMATDLALCAEFGMQSSFASVFSDPWPLANCDEN